MAKYLDKSGLQYFWEKMKARIGGYKTPEMFGAKGDGETDDTNALIDCFANGGNILLEKDKVYCISSYIPVVSNSVIQLDGTISALGPYGDTSLEFYDRVTGAGGYGGVHDVVLFGDGVIDMHGDTLSDSYATPLRIHHCKNITIKGITIKNYSKYHAIETGGTDGLVIDGVKFLGCFANGDTGHHEAIQIEAISEAGSSGAIPYDGTVTKNVIIRNCLFNGSEEGGLSYSSIGCHYYLNDPTWTNYFSNIQIVNNTFLNNNDGAIWFDTNFKDVIIEGNLFQDQVATASSTIRFDKYIKDINITGNTFNRLRRDILILGIDNATQSLDDVFTNVVFKDNYIKDYNLTQASNVVGIAFLCASEDCSVVNNTFEFDTTYSNRPVFISGYYRSDTYTKNLVVDNNVINGEMVSRSLCLDHVESANTIAAFLENRINLVKNTIKYPNPVAGDLGGARNVYFVAGSKVGTADAFSIAYLNRENDRLTMITQFQPTNVPKIVVSQNSGSTTSHYQVVLTAFSE